ncbi:MAG: hypothetical protein RLZZ184_2321 [Cyanobacteriota bacterium]|jgi:hypothetical protein
MNKGIFTGLDISENQGDANIVINPTPLLEIIEYNKKHQ